MRVHIPTQSPIATALAHVDALSNREAEVFLLMAEAPSYEAIAQRLGVTRRTIRFHMTKIREKLGDLSYPQLCVVACLRLHTRADERPAGGDAPGDAMS